MSKYVMIGWCGGESTCVVEADNLTQAFVKFTEYYAIPYPLTTKGLENLFKDFDVDKFVKFFENYDGVTVYQIYEIKNIVFEKKLEGE